MSRNIKTMEVSFGVVFISKVCHESVISLMLITHATKIKTELRDPSENEVTDAEPLQDRGCQLRV